MALRLWRGAFDSVFLAVALVQLAAWFINLLNSPSYMLYLGVGRLRWIMLSHGLIALLTAVLGAGLGWLLGGAGVLIGGAAALALGSLLVPAAFHREYGIAWRDLNLASSVPGVVLLIAAICASAAIAQSEIWPGWGIAIGLPVSAAILALVISAFNPMGKKLVAEIDLPRRLGRVRE